MLEWRANKKKTFVDKRGGMKVNYFIALTFVARFIIASVINIYVDSDEAILPI